MNMKSLFKFRMFFAERAELERKHAHFQCENESFFM